MAFVGRLGMNEAGPTEFSLASNLCCTALRDPKTRFATLSRWQYRSIHARLQHFTHGYGLRNDNSVSVVAGPSFTLASFLGNLKFI